MYFIGLDLNGQNQKTEEETKIVRPANLKNEHFTGIRGAVAKIVEHPYMLRFITTLILINAVTLGMATDDTLKDHLGHKLDLVDHVILGVFVIEIAMKLFVYRLSFFRAGWNMFDFLIVGVSLIPATEALSIMRALRIMRVLRLMSTVPQMRRVVAALLTAIPGMTSIVAVLFIIFYVAAVFSTQVFGASDDPYMQELFGSIGASMYTLFQVMTLEGWADGVANPTLMLFPWAWLFFVPFIIITSFAVLNLFIGIIVDAMQIVQEKDLEEEEAVIKDEIHALRADVAELKSLLLDAKGK